MTAGSQTCSRCPANHVPGSLHCCIGHQLRGDLPQMGLAQLLSSAPSPLQPRTQPWQSPWSASASACTHAAALTSPCGAWAMPARAGVNFTTAIEGGSRWHVAAPSLTPPCGAAAAAPCTHSSCASGQDFRQYFRQALRQAQGRRQHAPSLLTRGQLASPYLHSRLRRT